MSVPFSSDSLIKKSIKIMLIENICILCYLQCFEWHIPWYRVKVGNQDRLYKPEKIKQMKFCKPNRLWTRAKRIQNAMPSAADAARDCHIYLLVVIDSHVFISCSSFFSSASTYASRIQIEGRMSSDICFRSAFGSWIEKTQIVTSARVSHMMFVWWE
jgi:hypothetical protein